MSNIFKKLEHKVVLLKEHHEKELSEKDKTIKELHKKIDSLITENISQESKLTEMEESISQFVTTI